MFFKGLSNLEYVFLSEWLGHGAAKMFVVIIIIYLGIWVVSVASGEGDTIPSYTYGGVPKRPKSGKNRGIRY